MKKIAMVMMVLITMMAGLFAYEPKKECVTVKRNGDFKYYEKTEPYEARGDWTKDYDDYVCWVIRKGYTVKQLVDYEYEWLEKSRRSWLFCMKKANNPNPSSLIIFITKINNEQNGTDTSPEEYERNILLENARKEMSWAVTALPFVTEENYLYLSKIEMLAKMNDFISACTK